MMKNILLMMVGGIMVIAYQKYKEPLMNSIECYLTQK